MEKLTYLLCIFFLCLFSDEPLSILFCLYGCTKMYIFYSRALYNITVYEKDVKKKKNLLNYYFLYYIIVYVDQE